MRSVNTTLLFDSVISPITYLLFSELLLVLFKTTSGERCDEAKNAQLQLHFIRATHVSFSCRIPSIGERLTEETKMPEWNEQELFLFQSVGHECLGSPSRSISVFFLILHPNANEQIRHTFCLQLYMKFSFSQNFFPLSFQQIFFPSIFS